MRLVSVLACCAALAACSPAPSTAQPPTPPPPPAGRGAMAKTLDGRLEAPPGFTVTIFAQGIRRARALALGPDGSVYVSQPTDGQIWRLVDADGNGVAERQEVVVKGLDRPHGMAFRDGWLWIANTNGIARVKLDATGVPAGAHEPVNSYSGGGGHWSRSILFGPDGAMYVSIGSTCNVCEEKTEDRAAVMRYDADGKNGRVFARGLRNAVGMAVHPETGEIWVSQHERDNLKPDHQDLPAEEINILRDGGDYGWPYCHDDKVPNPEFPDAARCERTIAPALRMQAHSAPLGMSFLAGATQFPAEYRGDLLLTFHGSWNRDEPTGAKVVRVKVQDGKPVTYEDFITGWQGADGKRWGRPVDVLVLRDGSVLVSDDLSGTVYRVSR